MALPPTYPTTQSLPVAAASRRCWRWAALLGVLIALIGVARWRVADEPADHDVCTYAIVGKELRHGRQLYAQVWDMKPPAIFATYAIGQWLAGEGPAMPWLLCLVAAGGTLVAVTLAAEPLGDPAACWTALLFAAICLQPALGACAPNTEAFISWFLAAGAALVLRDRGTRVRPGRWVGVGVLFGIATLYKQVALPPAAAICLAHMLIPPEGRTRRHAAIEAAVALTAALACWGLVATWFAATGRFQLLYDTCVTYSRYYGGSVTNNLRQGLRFSRLYPPCARELVPLLALIAVGIPAMALARRREGLILLAWIIATTLAVAMPGKFFPHYYELWLAPLAVAGGWSAAVWSRAWRGRSPLLPRIATGTVLLGLLWMQGHWFTGDLPTRGNEKLGDLFMTADNTGREITGLLGPGETLFVWGDEPEIYWEAHQRPPTQALWRTHMTQGPMAGQLARQALTALQRAPPDMLARWSWLGDEHSALEQWMEGNYRELPGNRHRLPLRLFARIGSALDRRSGPKD